VDVVNVAVLEVNAASISRIKVCMVGEFVYIQVCFKEPRGEQ
jgi:hypothetical protein